MNNKSPTTLVLPRQSSFALEGSSGTCGGVGLLSYSAKSTRVRVP